jgi:hypothetical protein
MAEGGGYKMQKVNFKFIHNIFLLVIFLFLMDAKSLFGLWFHEWAGLLICLFYILHNILNWNWIKESTKRLFGRLPAKVRLNYIMDVLLLVGFILIIWSGMAISKTINFSWLGFDQDNRMIYRSMHTSVSMLTLAVAGIHLGLHWDWVLARFERSSRRPS